MYPLIPLAFRLGPVPSTTNSPVERSMENTGDKLDGLTGN